jgi:hypothetical protein
LRVPPSFLKDPKKLEEYVHKHIFPRVSAFERTYLTQFFTEIFSDGFESGNFNGWTGTNVDGDAVGQVNVEMPHHGTYGFESWVTDIANDNAYCYKTLTSATEFYVRAYVRVYETVITSGRYTTLLTLRGNSDAYHLARVCVRGDGTDSHFYLIFRHNGASGTSIENAVVEDQWYCIELRCKMSTAGNADGIVEFWIDGNQVYSKTDVDNDDQATSMDTVRLGCNPGAGSGSNFGFYGDCVVVADAYIGPEGGAVLKEVADSLGLAEAVLRNKTLILSDSLGLAEALYGNKSLLLSDSASLSELVTVIIGQVMKYVADAVSAADLVDVLKTLKMSDTVTLVDAVSTPSRVLRTLEAIGATDSFVVNKVLQITETVSLAEIVEVGTGGVKKTKLFLILGDLAVQLTDD